MIRHHLLSEEMFKLLKSGAVTLAGNWKLKVYGLLNCSSGKRMKKENRVFFKDETEAKELDFRPCGHCMQKEYVKWKSGSTF